MALSTRINSFFAFVDHSESLGGSFSDLSGVSELLAESLGERLYSMNEIRVSRLIPFLIFSITNFEDTGDWMVDAAARKKGKVAERGSRTKGRKGGLALKAEKNNDLPNFGPKGTSDGSPGVFTPPKELCNNISLAAPPQNNGLNFIPSLASTLCSVI